MKRKACLPLALSASCAMTALLPAALCADTVTLAPPTGTTTNALALYTGDTALNIAGPGTVKLNPSNSHTGGTTLSGGTLEISGNVPADIASPVGTGTFTVSGGTLLGSGTFGGDITGTGNFTTLAPNGWAWTGDNTFAATNTIADGILEIAGGTTAFNSALNVCRTTEGPSGLRVTGGTVTIGDRLHLGEPAPAAGLGDLPASYEQTGGSVTMGGNLQLGFSHSSYGQTTFTMTGGTFNLGGKNIVSGYQATYTTNTVDVSGTAVLGGVGNFYIHNGSNNGAGNRMDVNVHDGGTVGFTALYSNNSTTKTHLRVDGGVLRNDKSGSNGAALTSGWIGNSEAAKQLTSFTVGPKGATFRAKNGNASGVAQVYSPMSAEPASAGETAAGVTIAAGRFAYYLAMDYEGPTTIRNGGFLYLSKNGALPAASAVIVEGGGMLRLMGSDKTIASLTLEDDATLGFGTPSEGANTSALTVSGDLELPGRAKIALYTKADVTGAAKNDSGTYAVLHAPVACADALRAVQWSCATAASGNVYSFSVTTSGETATLSMTISAAESGLDAAAADGGYGAVTGNLVVNTDIDVRGTLSVSGSVFGSAAGGSLAIHDGGVLDLSNGGGITPVNASGNSFDLYLEEGGSILVKNIQASGNAWDGDAWFHFNGGTIYPFYGKAGDGTDNGGYQMLLNYQKATVGEHGLAIDLSRWVRPADFTKWMRISLQGWLCHDPACEGPDGGLVIRGAADEKALVYFGGRFAGPSPSTGSTFNGGIRVEDGAIVSSISYALVGQTLTMEPGSRLRPYFGTPASPTAVQIGTLTLGASGATKPVALDTTKVSSLAGCYVVSNGISVLSPVEIGTCANWASDNELLAGTFTPLVYRAEYSVDPALFQLPAAATAAGFTLSAQEVTISGGAYDGWKKLVCTISGTDLVVAGTSSHPSPQTVATDAGYDKIIVGGTYGGEDDPCVDTSLTISGNVTASGTLYLGYDAKAGVDANHPHQGFLTIDSGASLSVPAIWSAYLSATPSENPRYGCELAVNGGFLDVSGDVRFGYSISKSGDKLYSQLTVNGGRVAVGGTFYLYYYQSTVNTGIPGCLVLNDGEVDVTGLLDLSRNNKVNKKSNGDDYDSILYHFGLYLNGGVLKAENIKMTQSGSVPKVYFNGGTFMPYGKAAANRTMQNLNVAYVSEGGAVISTENLPAGETYTIAQALLTDPALDGAADGGLVKKGAGTLALTGANTFNGPVSVEQGLLLAESGALPSTPFAAAVADGAGIYAPGSALSLTDVAASGAIVADSVSVSGALALTNAGSVLSVYGDLTLDNRATIDFGLGEGETPPADWTPVAAVSGTITAPASFRASNVGAKNRCDAAVIDGVLYVRAIYAGTILTIR